jgi:hypothetical protein
LELISFFKVSVSIAIVSLAVLLPDSLTEKVNRMLVIFDITASANRLIYRDSDISNIF